MKVLLFLCYYFHSLSAQKIPDLNSYRATQCEKYG